MQRDSAADAPGVASALGAARERMLEARGQRQRRGAWWNDAALSTTVALTPAQRQALTAAMERSQAEQAQAMAQGASARRRYREALLAGDTAAAETAAGEMAEATAVRLRAEHLLPVRLLEVLEPAQRDRLRAEGPGLVLDPVRSSARGRRARAAAGGEAVEATSTADPDASGDAGAAAPTDGG